MAVKNNVHGVNVDLASMAKMQVGGSLKKKDQNVKKVKSKKNCFVLGFDPGFTKLLLRNSMNEQSQNRKVKIVIGK